jgi:hypothetical protein
MSSPHLWRKPSSQNYEPPTAPSRGLPCKLQRLQKCSEEEIHGKATSLLQTNENIPGDSARTLGVVGGAGFTGGRWRPTPPKMFRNSSHNDSTSMEKPNDNQITPVKGINSTFFSFFFFELWEPLWLKRKEEGDLGKCLCGVGCKRVDRKLRWVFCIGGEKEMQVRCLMECFK